MEKEGLLTEAEAIYAELTAPNNDPLVLIKYADFLFRIRRKAQSKLYTTGACGVRGCGTIPMRRPNRRPSWVMSIQRLRITMKQRLFSNKRFNLSESLDRRRDLAEARLRLGEVQAAKRKDDEARRSLELALKDLDFEDDLEVRADLNAALAQGSADRREFDQAAQQYELASELQAEVREHSAMSPIYLSVSEQWWKRSSDLRMPLIFTMIVWLFLKKMEIWRD